MLPRRIALLFLFFVVFPIGLGWWLIHHLGGFQDSRKRKESRPAEIDTFAVPAPDVVALVSACETDPAASKTKRMVQEAQARSRYFIEVFSRKAIGDHPISERKTAIKMLGTFPSERTVEALRDAYPRFLPHAELRKEAVNSLTLMGGFGAFDVLVGFLPMEGDPGIRKQMIQSLTLLASEKDIPKLEAALKQTKGLTPEEIGIAVNAVGSRRSSMDLLVEINQADPANPQARDRLKYLLLNHPMLSVRTASIQKLAGSGVPEAAEIVAAWVAEAAVSGKEEQLVDVALTTLARQGGKEIQDVIAKTFQPRIAKAPAKERWDRYQRLRQASEPPKK